MEQARAVLDRLDRIDALAAACAPATDVLDDVRALVGEADAWIAAEPAAARPGPAAAVERCRAALEASQLTTVVQEGVIAVPAKSATTMATMTIPRMRRSPQPAPSEAHARVIAFANQKGGVAKTTSTLNLAVALKERGLRVLVVDLDPQGNLTMSQGLNPDTIERSMFDVLVHRLPIQEIIAEREIDVAVSSIDLAGAELALSGMIGRERALEKALAPVRDSYDYILMDTPPSLGLLTINAFVAADGVIVPVQCEYLSLRGLVQLENTLAMIRENLNPRVKIEGILPTMFDRRLLHCREAVEILQENFGDLVLKTRIRKTIRYAEAPVQGTSVLSYEPEGEAAEAYRDLAKEVLRRAA